MKLLTRMLALLLTVVLGGAVLPAVQPALAATPTFYALDNDKIRFGTGSEGSITSEGLLKQPFYKSGASWYKLTYSTYSLDLAIGLGGSGTGTWNTNGTIFGTFTGYGITSLTTDYSGFVKTADVGTGAKGYGVVVSTGDVTKTFNNVSYTIRVQNTYELGQASSFVKITTKITNVGASTVSNLRTWVGTRDDWVGNSDSTTKTRGTIDVTNGFVAGTSNASRNPALKISSGAEAVIFYSPHASANTSINSCCSFSNAYNTNPSTSQLALTNDGSYSMFVPLSDLTTNSSDEFVWYYAAGSTADIATVVEQVAQAAASWNDQTITSTVLAGAAYSDAVSAGGTGTITYSVTSGYSLPAGLSLNSSTGAITGNPTTTGSYTFRISATSVSGNTSSTVTTADLNLTVGQIPTLSSSTLTSSIVALTSVSQSVTASAYPAPTYSVSSGSLPTGLSLNSSTGAITGTPSATGDFTFTISASNSFGSSSLITQSTSVVAAPAFTDSAINARATKGVAYSSEVAASGWPAPTYSVTSGSLPAGLTLNPTTGAISGTATSSGDYSFSISATNSQGAVSTSSLSIQVGSSASVSFDQMPQFGYIGVALDISASTGGFPSPTYSVSSGSLPPGLSVNASSGQITGTPTQAGTFTFAISASNWVSTALTSNFQVTIYSSPTIQNASSVSQSIAIGSSFSADLTADVAVDAWRVDSGSFPQGISLDDSTGVISGLPTISGRFEVQISGRNAAGWGAGATVVLEITEAPTLSSLGNQVLEIGKPFSATLVATGYPSATFSIASGALPSGLSIDPATGTLSGTPTETGNFQLSVAAVNSVGDDETEIATFTIASVPTLTDGQIDSDIELGSTYSSSISFDGFPAVTMEVIDASKLPPGITFDGSTGMFSGTPTETGTFTFDVFATNEYFSSDSTSLTISVNRKPSLSSKSVSGDFLVGSDYLGSVVAIGYPAPSYTLASGTLPPGVSLNSSNGVLSGQLTKTGEYKFVIEATNTLGTYRFTQGAISVGETPPKLSSRTIEVTQGEFFNNDLSVDIFPVPDYTIKSGDLPSGVSLTPSGFLRGTPAEYGHFEFTIEISNWAGVTESAVISLDVLTAPSLLSQELDQQINLAEIYQDSVSVTAFPSATYSIKSGALPEGLTLDPSTGEIFGLATDIGTYTFVVKAENKVGTFVFEEKTISVGKAPTRVTATSITGEFGVETNEDLSASSFPAATYQLSTGTLPQGLVINSDGSITGKPTEYGKFEFTLLASSWAGETESEVLTINILKAPELEDGDLSNQIIKGEAYRDSISAIGYPVPKFEIIDGSLPPGITLNQDDGSISGTAGTAGEYRFTIRASNIAGYFDFSPSIISVGLKPESRQDYPNFSALRSDFVNLDFSTEATPTPHYEISEGSIPAGLVFDTTTGRLSGNPTVLGAFAFKVKAISWAGSSESEIIHFDVESAPILVSSTLGSRVELGADVNFGFSVEAYPAPEFSISDGSLPPGLEFDSDTGTFHGSAKVRGKFTFSILVSNALGALDLGQFTLEITDSPKWTNVNTPEELELGSDFEFQLQATGYPAPSFSVASGTLPSGLSLSEQGRIYGTPTKVGDYSFSLSAKNEDGEVVQTRSIRITQVPELSVQPIGSLSLGARLDFEFGVSGYPKPTLAISGELPAGLTFAADQGQISGNVSSPGDFEFFVTATNSTGSVTSEPITFSVVTAPRLKSNELIKEIALGAQIEMGFEILAHPKPSFVLSSGSLPPGLVLDSQTGQISGKATEPGKFTFSVVASNSLGETNLGTHTISVIDAPKIDLTEIPSRLLLGEYISTSNLFSGYPKPTVQITSGQLPPGINLGANGRLFGTPSAVGRYKFEVTTFNSAGRASQEISIVVNQVPSLSNDPVPQARINKPFSFQISSSGYPLPTISLEGKLPPGLSFDSKTGLISGTPYEAGSFELTATAQNESGRDSRTLNLLVRTISVKPKITVQASLGKPIAGAPVDVEVIGAKPGADYIIELHSEPIILGQGKVPNDGQVVVNAAIPAALEPGWHRIELRTTGEDDSNILDTLYFEVTANGLLETEPQSDPPTAIEVEASLSDDLAFLESMGLDPAALVPAEIMQEQAEKVVTAVAALTLVAGAASAAGAVAATGNISSPLRQQGSPMAPATGGSSATNSGSGSRSSVRRDDTGSGGSSGSGDGGQDEAEISYGAIEGELDDFSDERTSWGDRLSIWKLRFMTSLDHFYFRLANAVAGVSPLAAKIVNDGSYLTAIFGVFSVLPTLVAVWFGISAVTPSSETIYGALNASAFTIVMALGTIDALAGFAGAVAMVATLLLAYGVPDAGVGRYALTILMLGFGPIILSTAFRKIRRNRVSNLMDIWERVTDLAVIFFISFLSTLSLLGAVSALAANSVSIAAEAAQIAMTVAIIATFRVLLEELAAAGFTARLEAINPTEVRSPSEIQGWFSIAAKYLVLCYMLAPVVGSGWALWVGGLVMFSPSLFAQFGFNLPKSKLIWQILPAGLVALSISTVLSGWSGDLVTSLFGAEANFKDLAYVLTPIPAVIVALVSLFAEPSVRPHDRLPIRNLVYIVGGSVIFIWTLEVTGFWSAITPLFGK